MHFLILMDAYSIYWTTKFINECWILPFLPIYNPGHISLRLLIIDQIFLLSQVKERVIISSKHGICELLNDLRLEILGN